MMGIPDFQSINLPLLKFASDKKEHSVRESIEERAYKFLHQPFWALKSELWKLPPQRGTVCAIRPVLERDSHPVFGSRHRLVVRKACIRCPRRSECTLRG